MQGHAQLTSCIAQGLWRHWSDVVLALEEPEAQTWHIRAFILRAESSSSMTSSLQPQAGKDEAEGVGLQDDAPEILTPPGSPRGHEARRRVMHASDTGSDASNQDAAEDRQSCSLALTSLTSDREEPLAPGARESMDHHVAHNMYTRVYSATDLHKGGGGGNYLDVEPSHSLRWQLESCPELGSALHQSSGFVEDQLVPPPGTSAREPAAAFQRSKTCGVNGDSTLQTEEDPVTRARSDLGAQLRCMVSLPSPPQQGRGPQFYAPRIHQRRAISFIKARIGITQEDSTGIPDGQGLSESDHNIGWQQGVAAGAEAMLLQGPLRPVVRPAPLSAEFVTECTGSQPGSASPCNMPQDPDSREDGIQQPPDLTSWCPMTVSGSMQPQPPRILDGGSPRAVRHSKSSATLDRHASAR